MFHRLTNGWSLHKPLDTMVVTQTRRLTGGGACARRSLGNGEWGTFDYCLELEPPLVQRPPTMGTGVCTGVHVWEPD